MWCILQQEFRYHKTAIVILLSFALPFYLWNAFFSNQMRICVQVLIFTMALLGALITRDETRDRRHRLYAQLPLPLYQRSLVRHGLWLLFWGTQLALLFFSELLSHSGRVPLDAAWLLIALSAALIVFISLSSISQDIPMWGTSTRPRILPAVVNPLLVLTAATVYVLALPGSGMSEPLADVVLTPHIALGGLGISLLLMIFSVIVYQRRQLFLD